MKRRFLSSSMYRTRRPVALSNQWFSSSAFFGSNKNACQQKNGARQLNERRPESHRCAPLFQSRMIHIGNTSALVSASHSRRSFSTASVVPQQDTAISIRSDFWGEPVTFLSPNTTTGSSVETAMAAMDDFSIAVVSKGSSCSGGGDDQGVPTMAAHSTGIVWAECIRQCNVWHTEAPMLVVAAVGPLLSQTNTAYLQTLDSLLGQTDEDETVSLLAMTKAAVAMKADERLTSRERAHLQALHHMILHERQEALHVLLRLLQQAPGDALALSLAIELANAIGDGKSALRAAGFVASYWQERGERGLRPSMPGYSLILSWIALGFAAGGRFAEAERLAERAIYQDAKSCGAVATWALAHVFDSEGRTAEAISKLSGDGVKYYETSGLLFFDGRLASYGARFLLDREGLGEGRSPLRMYDTAFERVLRYSGYSNGRPWTSPQRQVPRARTERMMDSVGQGAKSFFGQMFGGKDTEPVQESEQGVDEPPAASKPTLEDVLAWMPPTPQLLTDATFLLLRLTVNGSVSPSDHRWAELTRAWITVSESMLDEEPAYDGEEPNSAVLIPVAVIAACLVCPPIALPPSEGRGAQFVEALSLFGELLRSQSADEGFQSTDETRAKWAKVTMLLSEAVAAPDECDGWDMELRPVLDQVICYAACHSEDPESLCIARSYNSLGVSLRPNCPEEWFRYGTVLEALGDDVAAEDARAASVSLGAGEGGAGAH